LTEHAATEHAATEHVATEHVATRVASPTTPGSVQRPLALDLFESNNGSTPSD
jgi:hypothetical protein